jgi:type IV pilus assembly protein PilQ
MNQLNSIIVPRWIVATLSLAVVLGGSAVAVPLQDDGAGFDPGEELLDLGGVEVDEFDTFNIQVQDTELAQVLQMLALQSERNVIASRNVSAVISANLFDVTFYEAMDAILKPNGFRWVEEGKFIYVYTQEEFARMQALDRKTESRMFELEHLSAKDASEFATPLLSDRGKLSFIGEVEGGIEQDLSNMGGDDWAKSAILVVNDYPEQLERIAELLAEIDTAPRQVVVDATIASVQVSESDAFGVDFALIGNLDVTRLVNPLGPVTDLLRGSADPPGGTAGNVPSPIYGGTNGLPAYGAQATPGNTASGPANMKLGLVAGDAAVFIRALDTVTDTMVLARPRLMALNRQRAQVLVGQRVAYLSTTSTDTTTTQTVQYLDTGVRLMFRPFISKDDSIRMELYPSVSSAELRPVTSGKVPGQLLVPDEFTNEISTNVKVADGQTLVLGGLFQETTRVTNSQVPFLGDIPILGAAFSGHDNDVTRREIIFLITPNIVEDSLIETSGRAGLAFVNSLRAGMREGLLPFSREKMSSKHNQSAFEAKQSGDKDKALYHLDNSLRLNPAQPGVRQLRAELTSSDSGEFYDYDIWNRIMQGQIREMKEQKAESARLDASVDPLAETEVEVASKPITESTGSVREARFVDQLVAELDLPIEESTEDAVVVVEASPMSVDEAFGSESDPETIADREVAFSEPVEVATESTTDDASGSLGAVVATAEVAEAPVVEENGPDPFTNADALRIAGDTQARIVTGPSLTGWGRLWWLARLAEDQARLFQPREAPGQAIATVNDEE